MKITDLPIEGLKLIELDLFADSRGFFVERYQQEKFADLGFNQEFVQDNYSMSSPGVGRGLHYQVGPAQGKLVGVMCGKVWDVAVDIRPNSPTFKQHYAVELSHDTNKLFWIPEGFAHGFCVLGDEPAGLFYKVNSYYSKEGDRGIIWNDPELNIPWPVDRLDLSEKDENLSPISQHDLSFFAN